MHLLRRWPLLRLQPAELHHRTCAKGCPGAQPLPTPQQVVLPSQDPSPKEEPACPYWPWFPLLLTLRSPWGS